MKKSTRLFRTGSMVLGVIAIVGMIFISCSKDTTAPSPSGHNLKATECLEATYTLWGGQTIDAGILTVWNDETTLYIDYTITATNLPMTEIHLWAGKDISLCPHNTPGNPKPGLFPYFANATSSTPAGYPYLTDPMHYALTIPLTDIEAVCDDIVYIAAHAATPTETLWGEGTGFPGNNWATYSTYSICCLDAQK